jgi:hypothetical protein
MVNTDIKCLIINILLKVDFLLLTWNLKFEQNYTMKNFKIYKSLEQKNIRKLLK